MLVTFEQMLHMSALSLQMVVEEGVYANGQVVVQPLPEAIFGPAAERTLPIRRLDAVLTEEQLQKHCDKELQQVDPGWCNSITTVAFKIW